MRQSDLQTGSSSQSTWQPWPPASAMQNCTVCQGTGWQILPVPGRSTARRCACASLSHRLRLKEQVRIPQRYENCSFDTFVPWNLSQARALKEARKFAERFPHCGAGLLFMGEPGVGKTHLATAILRELVQKLHHDMLFVDFATMLDGLQGADAKSDRWRPLEDTSLLVLDNFGAMSSDPDRLIPAWEDLLDSRYRRRRPIIFTSERIHFDDLFANSPASSASGADAFLRQLSPALLYGLFSRIKALLMSGCEIQKQTSRSAPLF